MEATGVYWRPVFYELEGLFDEVWLCNAAHVKNVRAKDRPLRRRVAGRRGRPRDGAALLRAPAEIREVRELTRYRKTQVDAVVKEIQRLEKTLQDAGIKLTSVASSVWLSLDRAMIEALIAGERDPKVLARWPSRAAAKIPQLEEAFSGRFGDHHAFCAARSSTTSTTSMPPSALNGEIARRSPLLRRRSPLGLDPGVSRTTAEVLIAEMGRHGPFPHAATVAWAGVGPASHESPEAPPAGTRRGAVAAPALVAVARRRPDQGQLLLGALRAARRRGPTRRCGVAIMVAVAWHLWNGPLEDPADTRARTTAEASAPRMRPRLRVPRRKARRPGG